MDSKIRYFYYINSIIIKRCNFISFITSNMQRPLNEMIDMSHLNTNEDIESTQFM